MGKSMPGLVFCGCYWGGQNMQNSSNSIQSMRQWQVSSAHVPLPYATPMLHRSVAWSGHIGTRCRAPYGSGASVCGGVVEKPPHNTLACARVRMRDAHKWGVERMVGTRIIRAARAGRPNLQSIQPWIKSTHYPCGACREALRPNIEPSRHYTLHTRGHGLCECAIVHDKVNVHLPLVLPKSTCSSRGRGRHHGETV